MASLWSPNQIKRTEQKMTMVFLTCYLQTPLCIKYSMEINSKQNCSLKTWLAFPFSPDWNMSVLFLTHHIQMISIKHVMLLQENLSRFNKEQLNEHLLSDVLFSFWRTMECRGLLNNKTNKELERRLWKALISVIFSSLSKLWNASRFVITTKK